MANKNFVVQYLIKARDAFSKNANKATKAFNNLDKSSKKATNSFKKLDDRSKRSARSFKGVSSSFVNNFKNMAGAALGFFSVKTFIEKGSRFQDALADLSAITGATGKDLEFLSNETMRLGKDAIVSSDQVATAFKLIGSAKSELLKDPKALSNVTEQVLLLANASGIDLTTAANVTVQSLNQFGAEADQTARFINVLAAGAKIGASEVAETGVAIIKAGAVAKDVGVGFEELNAAVQVLARGGVKAEVAGTGLKTALLVLESSGIKTLQPSVVGLSGSLENLSKMNLNVTQMTKIFGREHVVIGSILSENAGLVKKWTKELTGTNIAQEQAEKRLKTFSKQLKKLGLIIDNTIIKTFLRLEPILTESAIKMAEWMDSVSGEDIKSFSDILGIILSTVVLIGKGFGIIVSSIAKAGKFLGEFAAALINLDFSQFNKGSKSLIKEVAKKVVPSAGLVSSIFDFFASDNKQLTASSPQLNKSQVDVGVNVGLDKGLKQTAPATVNRSERRNDTGSMHQLALAQ